MIRRPQTRCGSPSRESLASTHRKSATTADRRFAQLGKLLLIAAVALLPLAFAEGAARLWHRPQPITRVWDPFAYRILQPSLEHAFSGLDGRPVTIRLNELGMRGPSIREARSEDALTVIFLGGSTTENYGLPREETFPELAGEHLRRLTDREVVIHNAGVSAATSGVSLGRLQHQVLDLRPSLVVVMHAINDLLGGLHPELRTDGRHLPRPPMATARPRSFLFDWHRRRPAGNLEQRRPLARSRERSVESYEDFVALDVFRRNLRSMSAIGRAHGVPLLFLTQPSMYADPPLEGAIERFFLLDWLVAQGETPPDIPSLARGMAAFNDVVRSLAEHAGHPAGEETASGVFELAASMPRDWRHFYDECHTTAEGNRRLAELLAPALATALGLGRN